MTVVWWTVVFFALGVHGTPYGFRTRHGPATLYSFDDPIAQLRRNNFTSTLIGSPRAWIVEFYASWCGHCQRFAPMWRDLAYDIQKWRKVVKVAAIACSEDVNAQACSSYRIRGYPTIKAFPHNADFTTSGISFSGEKTLENLKHFVVSFVSSLPKHEEWPNLHTHDSLDSYVKSLINSYTSKHEFVVLEPNTRDVTQTSALFVGREVILDWSSKRKVNFGRIKYNSEDSKYYTNSSVPMIYCLHRKKTGSQRLIKLIDDSGDRQKANDAIDAHINKRTETTPSVVETTTVQLRSTTSQVPTAATTMETPSIARNYSGMGLYLEDLEYSLKKTFFSEIPLQELASGPRLNALINYLEVLSEYYPGKVESKRYIGNMYHWLKGKSGRFYSTSDELRQRLQSTQNDQAFLSNDAEWVGCRGSQHYFRGYPCSMWMTFHALTVNAYLQEGENDDFNPQTILEAIREYIRHFFGCRHCADHFVRRAANITEEVDPENKESAIIWLWKVHNEVNQRLSGDTTEDPQHPKLQFPPEELCGTCRISKNLSTQEIQWNETEILTFLIEYYRMDNVFMPKSSTEPVPSTTEVPQMDVEEAVTEKQECTLQPTPWSECSKTCDTGFSYRMNLDDSSCSMKLETRLCNMDPCVKLMYYRYNGECTYSLARTERIEFGKFNVTKSTDQPWIFCKKCPSCKPRISHTEVVVLEGEGFSGHGQMEIIDECECP